MWLINSCLVGGRWCISVAAKMFRVVPGATLAVILSTLISQVSQLLAFFLPLKVVILMGSDGVPRYFPPSFFDVDRQFLVLSLSAAAGGFYLLHLAAEKVVDYSANRGASRVLERSSKLVLFADQEEIAKRVYQRIARAAAGLLFALVGLLVLALIYPALASLLGGFLILSFVGVAIATAWIGAFRAWLQCSASQLLSTLSSIGFLLAFAFLVLEYLNQSLPNVLIAIIAMLLSRQLLQRVARAVSDGGALNAQQIKINSLFFHGHALAQERSRAAGEVWALIGREQRGQWLPTVVAAATDQPVAAVESHWLQTGIDDVIALRAVACDGDGKHLGEYLVKLFGDRRRLLAMHERTLLSEQLQGDCPTVRLLGADEVDGFACNVFEWPGGREVSRRRLKAVICSVQASLWRVRVPDSLVGRFRRSRLMLPERLSTEMAQRLTLVAEAPSEVALVERFSGRLADIQARLGALPLCLLNSDLSRDLILRLPDGKFRVTHWGRWRIEPLGAGWPVKNIQALPSYLTRAAANHPRLQRVPAAAAQLAALVFGLERAFHKQQYAEALKLLPAVLDCLDRAESDCRGRPVSA